MSYASWHVGMEVVCVDDSFQVLGGCTYAGPLAVKGLVYTIASMRAHKAGDPFANGRIVRDCVFIELREIGPKVAFGAEYFRPVQKRKTDISIFTAMLNPKREHART